MFEGKLLFLSYVSFGILFNSTNSIILFIFVKYDLKFISFFSLLSKLGVLLSCGQWITFFDVYFFISKFEFTYPISNDTRKTTKNLLCSSTDLGVRKITGSRLDPIQWKGRFCGGSLTIRSPSL